MDLSSCIIIKEWNVEDIVTLPAMLPLPEWPGDNWCSQTRNILTLMAYISTLVAIGTLCFRFVVLRPKRLFAVAQFIASQCALICLHLYSMPLVWLYYDGVTIAQQTWIAAMVGAGSGLETIAIACIIRDLLKHSIKAVQASSLHDDNNNINTSNRNSVKLLRLCETVNWVVSFCMALVMIIGFTGAQLAGASGTGSTAVVTTSIFIKTVLACIAVCCFVFIIVQTASTIILKHALQQAIDQHGQSGMLSSSLSGPRRRSSSVSLSYSTASLPSLDENTSASTDPSPASTPRSTLDGESINVATLYCTLKRKLGIRHAVSCVVFAFAGVASIITCIWPVLLTLFMPVLTILASLLASFYYISMSRPVNGASDEDDFDSDEGDNEGEKRHRHRPLDGPTVASRLKHCCSDLSYNIVHPRCCWCLYRASSSSPGEEDEEHASNASWGDHLTDISSRE